MKKTPPGTPRLLVTGACGQLARQVIPVLRDRYHLLLTDILPSGAESSGYLQADLASFEEVSPLMEGIDLVLHCAAVSHDENEIGPEPRKLRCDEERILRANIHGTYHVFEAARRSGVRKIVYLSSLTSHLGNKSRPWYDSATPVEPANLYACTKIFGDNVGRLYAREHNVSVICLRLGQPYPLHARLDEVWRTNRRARSWFVTIEDINLAILASLETETRFGLYNIVSASDNQRFDISDAREIGYVPRGYFSDEGLSFFEDGTFPPSRRPVVTEAS